MLAIIDTDRIPQEIFDAKKELLWYQCIKSITIRSTMNNRRYPIGIIIKYKTRDKDKVIKQSLILPKDITETLKHITLELEEKERVTFIEERVNRGYITHILLATNQGKYVEWGIIKKKDKVFVFKVSSCSHLQYICKNMNKIKNISK